MDTFSLHAGSINLIALVLLIGIVLAMLIFNSYTLISNKDRLLQIYNFYLLSSLLFAGWNVLKLVRTRSYAVFYSTTKADEFATGALGLVCILFFGYVFKLHAAKVLFRFAWYGCIIARCSQLALLLINIVGRNQEEFNSMLWPVVNVSVILTSLTILLYAIILEQKTGFQKIILSGAIAFNLIALLSNFQLSGANGVFLPGINLVIIAFVFEHLFYATASANRTNHIYTEAEKRKAAEIQHQLKTEQVINYFATSIAVKTSVNEMLEDVAKNLIGRLGFEECMIYLWNHDKTILVQKAGYGVKGSMEKTAESEKYNVPKGKGIVGATVDSGQYILVNNTEIDKRYFAVDGKIMLSELCVPIIHNKDVIGAINTEYREKNFYTEWHQQILLTISSMLADKIDTLVAQQQTREKEMEVLRLNKDLATSQLTALRSQMNPHFIFNALNSVQQYILQGDITEANRYLSKFSKLQRDVLNNSDQNFISLEKELETLNLYLELEQLRFDGNFVYQLNLDAAIDPDEIKIPPMIIQPFVENSIWHGLMPKQGERWVHIEFTLNKDELLVCKVTDNGIGRNAAKRIKQNNGTQHSSKGLTLVYDRLSILRKQYDQAFDVVIHDMKDANGLPVGTEVILNIYTS
ncbi:MAG: histidine kinase [Chitinophagaceae bacterium]|nr:histidine kinase [Chitinophagaceae bacterium]